MTRIIAGTAGGLRLTTVAGTATRPTTDRVKESLFARLEAWGMCEDARVLDLFAGSGALGLEAASRGAREVTLVEKASAAASACRSNVRRLEQAGVTARMAVVHAPVHTYLARAGREDAVWDLVLADPPYPLPDDELTALLASLPGRLGPGAVVVVERSARGAQPAWPEGLERFECTVHGETVLHYLEESGDHTQAASEAIA